MAYAPLTKIPQQFFDNLGNPLVSGTLYAYLAGTSTPTNMFSDNAGTVAGTSVVLDSRGEPTTFKLIWLNTAVIYKFVLKDSTGTTIWTIDNISGDDGTGNTASSVFDQQTLTATAGQTLFTLGYEYVTGTNAMAVYKNGSRLITGTDFTETSSTSVTLTMAAIAGDEYTFIGGQDVSSSFSGTNVSFIQSGTGAVTRSVQTKLRETVSVKDFGAVGDGVTNDTAAIQAAITSLSSTGGTVCFPAGTYLVSVAINLISNLILDFAGGAKLKHASGVTTEYILRGQTKDNLTLQNMVVEGNGLAGLSSVYLTSCNNVFFNNCVISKAGSHALLHDSCTFVKVIACDFSQNYYYGVDERSGTGCKYIGNRFYLNGNTGVATSTGGRGINIWKSADAYVAGNRFVSNTEYGFRLYSEVADGATENRACILSGNYFYNNTASDIVVYNESGNVIRHVIADNIIERAANTTIGASVVIQGKFVKVSNTHYYKTGAFGTEAAFLLYQTNDCSIVNCSAKNTLEAVAFGTSTNCLIDGFVGDGIARVGIPLGSGITVKNSRFLHGGGGASDVAIQNYSATGKNYFEGNIFDGFHTGIYIASEAVAIFRNTSVNSTFTGLRISGNNIANLECGENSWDSATPWELSALRKTVSTYDKAQTYYISSPVSLTWARGDRCVNSSPAVGSPKAWVCTVAGTPGTWVSEGNL